MLFEFVYGMFERFIFNSQETKALEQRIAQIQPGPVQDQDMISHSSLNPNISDNDS